MDDLAAVVQNIDNKIRNLQSTSKSNVGTIMLGQFGLGSFLTHLAGGDLTHGIIYSMGGPWLAAQALTNPTAVKALTASMQRLDAAIDASARAVIDLNTIPKLPSARQAQPATQPNQRPQVPMSQ